MTEPTISSAAPRPWKAQDDLMNRLCDMAFWLHPQSTTGALMLDAADEIDRMRTLITEWADASENDQNEATNASAVRYVLAADALRKAVGR